MTTKKKNHYFIKLQIHDLYRFKTGTCIFFIHDSKVIHSLIFLYEFNDLKIRCITASGIVVFLWLNDWSAVDYELDNKQGGGDLNSLLLNRHMNLGLMESLNLLVNCLVSYQRHYTRLWPTKTNSPAIYYMYFIYCKKYNLQVHGWKNYSNQLKVIGII